MYGYQPLATRGSVQPCPIKQMKADAFGAVLKFLKMKYLIFLFLLFLAACDPFNRCPSYLAFYLPVTVEGMSDTLHIGDTVRLSLKFNHELAEEQSSDTYKFVDYDFKLVGAIEKIDSPAVSILTYTAFDWTTHIGDTKQDQDALIVIPNYSDNTYTYDVSFVPKEKGLFLFSLGSISSRLTPLENPDGPCSRQPVELYSRIADSTDTNFDFLKYSIEPVYVNMSRTRFDGFAGFCFFVK